MKGKAYVSGLLLLTMCGCSGMNNTESGLLGGTAIGAGLGTLIGLATHHPVAGAVAGGVVGGAVGATAGADQDRRDVRTAQVQAAVDAQARNQMTLNEIVQMSQQRTPDQIIINAIVNTNSVFVLRADDITYLRQQGVSDPVVSFMQTRPYRRVVVAPVYGPPPPVVVGVGVGGYYR